MPNNQVVPSITFTSVTGKVYNFTWNSDKHTPQDGRSFVEDLSTLTEVIPRNPEALLSTLNGTGLHEYVIHHKRANEKVPSRLDGVIKVVNVQNKDAGLLYTVQMRGNRFRSFYWQDVLGMYQAPAMAAVTNGVNRINLG